jgi:hypothetical protein
MTTKDITYLDDELENVRSPQPYRVSPPPPQYNEPTCLVVARHVESCPICSRFYNPSTLLHNIIIIILIAICIYLVHRAIHQ